MTDIPHRDLAETEAARLWATDRESLGECRRRHMRLVAATEAVETQGGN